MVVVADGVEDREPLDRRGVGEILREAVFTVLPVQVPGHVAQGQGIDLPAGVRRDARVDVPDEFVELLAVLVAVGEVDIAEDEHRVLVLPGNLLQGEVHALRGRLRLGELLVQQGPDAVGRDLVAGGHADEDVAVLLLGFQLIDALRVGLRHFVTVGDRDALQRRAVAGDEAIDRAARSRLHAVAGDHDADRHRPFRDLLGAALDGDRIGPVGEEAAPEPGNINGEFRRGRLQDCAVLLRSASGEHDHVAHERRLLELHPEIHRRLVLLQRHAPRDGEFHILQGSILLLSRLLAGHEDRQ